MNWNDYYLHQTGYGIDRIYRAQMYQRGYGLGNAFKRFFRWIVPIFKQHALPALKSGATALKDEALSSASNIVNDVLEGKDIKESANQNLESSIANIKDKVEKKLQGKGIKGRRKKLKVLYKKQHAVFSQNESE